jgi:hypothetical protein
VGEQAKAKSVPRDSRNFRAQTKAIVDEQWEANYRAKVRAAPTTNKTRRLIPSKVRRRISRPMSQSNELRQPTLVLIERSEVHFDENLDTKTAVWMIPRNL